VFGEYQASRHKATATHLPRLAEIAVMAAIANLFLDGGQADRFDEWIDKAILDAAGGKPIQDYLRGCRQKQRRVNVQHILGRPLAANEKDANPSVNGAAIADEAIRLRAYLKWEAAGTPEGDGVSFWLEAEREIRAGT
jgi:hypothetical protein